ncbi:MAG: cohesin domain-containing protein [Candidatus Bathyarchaeota archaeon]|nr:cohesin domain-containing protein [Candidatus Bathyarchaeota archaeon]
MLFLCIALLTAYPIFLGLQPSQSEILVPPDGEKISDNDSSSDNTSIPIEEASVKTLIVVNPNNISLVASESFTINIDIINVEDLSAYDLRLTYDDTIVTAIDVIIGDFFPKNCFVIKKEVTKNVPCSENIPTVWIAVSAPWGCPDFAVSGNGTLATIRFKAISTGNCTLKLYKTQILNPRTKNYADAAQSY